MFPGSGFIPSSQFALCCNHQILVSSQYLAVSEDAPGGVSVPHGTVPQEDLCGMLWNRACSSKGCKWCGQASGRQLCDGVEKNISSCRSLLAFLQAAWSADLAFGPWIG